MSTPDVFPSVIYNPLAGDEGAKKAKPERQFVHAVSCSRNTRNLFFLAAVKSRERADDTVDACPAMQRHVTTFICMSVIGH